MGKVNRKRHSAEFKARSAFEAIRGEHTLAEIGAKYGIYLTMVAALKTVAIEGMTTTFSPKAAAAVSEAELTKLHVRIGWLVAERDFLAKASGR